MHFQAWTELFAEDGLAGDFQFTGAKRIIVPEKLQQIVGVGNGAVRPEIGSVLAVHPAGEEHPGELLIGHDYPGISLGILEEYVVVRLVLFDEIVLQKQGIGFGIHYRKLGVSDLGDKQAGFDVESLRGHEILGHPLMEVLGLTHINHLPRGIVVAINPRGMWKQGYLLPDSETLAAQDLLDRLDVLGNLGLDAGAAQIPLHDGSVRTEKDDVRNTLDTVDVGRD